VSNAQKKSAAEEIRIDPKPSFSTVRTSGLSSHQKGKNNIPFQPGERLENYQLISILGQGSFGTVYLAREVLLQRDVALKVCPEDFFEGRTIAQLDHEGIIRVHSQKIIQGYCVIDMQYIPSKTLGSVFQSLKAQSESSWDGSSLIKILEESFPNPTLTLAQYRCRELLNSSSATASIAWLGLQIAEAISHAHNKGILHLDIKPENILIHPSGKPYVMDFNVSIQKSEALSGVPQNYGGTFDYMSPEQRGVFESSEIQEAEKRVRSVREPSDIYSLGLVLQEMLELGLERDHDYYYLKNILVQATQKDIAARYQTMSELGSALDGFLKIIKIRLKMPPLGPILTWTKKHPILGLTLMGGIPQGLAAAVGYLYNYSQVINRLGEKQTALFNQINFQYSLSTSFLAFVIWGCTLFRLSTSLRAVNTPGKTGVPSAERKFLITIPRWGSSVAAVSWLPGAFIFPWALTKYGEGLDFSTQVHLVSSFLLSFIIAFSYSFIIHTYVMVLTLYSDFWRGETQISEKARGELIPLYKKLKIVSLFTFTIPLTSILTVLYRNDSFKTTGQYEVFRVLLVLLVSPGTLGMWFVFYAREQVRMVKKLFISGTG